jgi:Fe2+ or Zn2+ uptake regulation protein
MNLLKKLFCLHKWKSHDKREFTDSKRSHFNPHEWIKTRNYTKEVLICENCGKIKHIEY